MAEVLFVEGFSHYRTGLSGSPGPKDMEQKNWLNADSTASGNVTIQTAQPRFPGSRYWRQSSTTAVSFIRSRLFTPHSALTVGAAMRTTEGAHLSLRSGTTFRLTLNVFVDTIQVRSGDLSGTVLIDVPHPTTGSHWNFYELEADIGASGSVTLYVNGVEYASFTGFTGSGAADGIYFRRFSTIGTNSATADLTDIYVADERIGDCRIVTLLPDAAGHHTDLTPDPTAANFTRVNSTTVNDTTLNKSDTPGDIDTYSYPEGVPEEAAIYAVVPSLRVSKSDAGARSARHVIRRDGTDHTGTDLVLPSAYQWYPLILDTDPETGFPWEVDDFHEAEFGIEVRS